MHPFPVLTDNVGYMSATCSFIAKNLVKSRLYALLTRQATNPQVLYFYVIFVKVDTQLFRDLLLSMMDVANVHMIVNVLCNRKGLTSL